MPRGRQFFVRAPHNSWKSHEVHHSAHTRGEIFLIGARGRMNKRLCSVNHVDSFVGARSGARSCTARRLVSETAIIERIKHWRSFVLVLKALDGVGARRCCQA